MTPLLPYPSTAVSATLSIAQSKSFTDAGPTVKSVMDERIAKKELKKRQLIYQKIMEQVNTLKDYPTLGMRMQIFKIKLLIL